MACPNAFFRFLYAPIAIAAFATLAACQSEPSLEEHRAARLEERYGYVDDTAISTRVAGALLRNASLKDSDIHVETANNVVRLYGYVLNERDAARAEQIALTVKDVQRVKDDLVVH